MIKVQAYDPANPPLGLMADLIYQTLVHSPRRIAFGGKAGAGKTEMCRLIAGTSELLTGETWMGHPPIPILNHADLIKEEVLQYVARCKTAGIRPSSDEAFVAFCAHFDLPAPFVRQDMGEIMIPLFTAMNQTLQDAYDHLPTLRQWAEMPPGTEIEAKVALVDEYKTYFRTSLQLYGQAIKDTGGDPYYWVAQTVNRGLEHKIALNGDTRFREEMEILEGTGWTTIWLDITRRTQKKRRPDLTKEQLAHPSENGLAKEDCRHVVDANQAPNLVLRDIHAILAPKSVPVTL